MSHEPQANKGMLMIFPKLYPDLKLFLQSVSFEGVKGKNKFEVRVDGLLLASNVVVLGEAKRALRESHVDQMSTPLAISPSTGTW